MNIQHSSRLKMKQSQIKTISKNNLKKIVEFSILILSFSKELFDF